MENLTLEVLINLASGLGGGGVFFLGYRLFKQKTELNDQQQWNDISSLVESLDTTNKLQAKNNELQQKQINNTDKEVMLLREKFQHYREISEKFQNQMLEENKKMDEVLSENTQAIVSLKATMEGLHEVFRLVLNNKNGL